MTWFKVDDTLAFHPKVLAAGNAAMGLWVRAGSWSAQQLTDGFVPDSVVATLDGKTVTRQLEAAGLWERVEGGWQFHDWTSRQPTREQVETERKAAKERMRRHRRKPETDDCSPDVQANSERTSDDVRLPRPDPTRPTSVSRRQQQDNRTDVLAAAAEIVVARRDLSDKSRGYVVAATRGVHADLVAWAATRKLDGLTPTAVADEFEPLPGPKLREVNGRMCQHIPGTGFVPVTVTA